MAVLPADTPDHPLADTRDVSNLLADSINQVRSGQLDPKVANTVGYLASVLLRSLEQGRTEEASPNLEDTVAKNPKLSPDLVDAAWLREKQPLTLLQKSTQYQKAWAAGFPANLWPAELVSLDGKDMLRLKDGTILEAQ